jgi:hypothetical protein
MMEICEMCEKNRRLQMVEYETDGEKREYIYITISNHQGIDRLKDRRHLNLPPLYAHNFPTLSAIDEGERVTTTLFTVGIHFIHILDLVLLPIQLLIIFCAPPSFGRH